VQLFGGDPTPGIVAAEFDEPNAVRVFIREGDGSTRVESDVFRPYAWDTDGGEGDRELAGLLPVRWLRQFGGWGEFQRGKGEAAFSFSDPVQQYLSLTGRTLFKGMGFEDLRRLQIDIETGTTEGFEFSSAERDPLTAIAVSDSSGWEEFVAVDGDESERAALEWITRVIQERDPDVIEGHNIFRFDLPFLAARAKRLKARLAWGRDGTPLGSRSSRLQIAEKTIQYPKFTVAGRHIVDTWLLAQYYDVGTRELEGFGLKSVARHFGVSEPNRILLDGAGIRCAREEDPEAFRLYALQDVRETRALAGILSRSYFVQAGIFPYGYQDVIVRGNATKIDALFVRDYLRAGHSLPKPPEPRPFEGGYTDIFVTGVVNNVWHCDVASLYPSVMLAFGIFPGSDERHVFGGLLGALRGFRLEAKAALRGAKDAAERNRLDALQATFKILINSFYGYLGFAQGRFADFDAAERVTAKGREILRGMVDWLGAQGAKVIEIDTDGIYFQPPPGVTPEGMQAGLAAILPEGIEVEFDKRYRAMFSYKAKNYALLDEDGTVHIVGAAFKSRGMEPYLRNYLGELLRLLLEGRASEANGLRETIAGRIRSRAISIADLAKTESLQDSPAAYSKKISSSSRNRSAAFELALASGRAYQAGDQVSYYIIGAKKKVVAYASAKFVSSWDPGQRDENVEYYIAKLDELAAKFSPFLSRQGDLFG